MCGIFGVFCSRRAAYSRGFLAQALRILVEESQSRGKDSSGLVVYDERVAVYDVFKGAIPLDALFHSSAVTSSLDRSLRAYTTGTQHTFAAFGHSRLVTNGTERNDENNQPVVKDGVIGIHNGIIVNDAALWERHPALSRSYQIDTEVMLALLRESLASGCDLPTAVGRFEAEIVGTVSTALLVPECAALVLYTNNGSLYTLTNDRDLLLFASQIYPLKAVAEHLKSVLGAGYRIQQVDCGSGVILNLEPFGVQRFVAADHLHATPDRGAKAEGTPGAIRITPVSDGRLQPELVADVAMIARAPEAARFEAMLEYNHDRVARLRRCSRCLLPETFPFVAFDARGVCNYCLHHKVRNQPKALDELLRLLAPYRRAHGSPDCIVPYSGGRDSTYALHIAKTRLGLNPIAFTYDWGMVTDLGRRNIARVCGKLRVENIIVAANIHRKRANIHKNITAWLRRPHLGMIPLFMAGDKYFYYYVEQVKRQTGIALNLWGINPMENTDFKVGFLGVPPDHDKEHIYSLSLRRKLSLFAGLGGAIAANPGYLNSSVFDTFGGFLARSVMPHRDYFHLFDYYQWNEPEVEALLLDEYDWETAIDTRTTWRIGDGTAAFYNYIYFTVAGFSEHDTFRSNQIREGMLSREEGLRMVNDENRPRYPTIKWYTDAVSIDYAQSIRIINSVPKLYA
jgi:glucosamine--fructose-6-phosphate aminotransferase (isomerizing)